MSRTTAFLLSTAVLVIVAFAVGRAQTGRVPAAQSRALTAQDYAEITQLICT